VAKVRETLVVNKQRSQRFHMESFTLKKLDEIESKEQYRVEVPNRFALWKIRTLRWKSVVLVKQLERI
jgi:hypothetical protein